MSFIAITIFVTVSQHDEGIVAMQPAGLQQVVKKFSDHSCLFGAAVFAAEPSYLKPIENARLQNAWLSVCTAC